MKAGNVPRCARNKKGRHHTLGASDIGAAVDSLCSSRRYSRQHLPAPASGAAPAQLHQRSLP